jgi:hypothetical protein
MTHLLVDEQRRESYGPEFVSHSDELGNVKSIGRGQNSTWEEAVLHELFSQFVREILVKDDYDIR